MGAFGPWIRHLRTQPLWRQTANSIQKMITVGRHGCGRNIFRSIHSLCRHTIWAPVFQVRGPLTEENVLEYFEESYLFDRSSNNNHLRMQTQHADPNYRMSRVEMETELKYAIYILIGFCSHPSRRFTGLEYALVHAQPPLFVIQRRDRLSPTEGWTSSLSILSLLF